MESDSEYVESQADESVSSPDSRFASLSPQAPSAAQPTIVPSPSPNATGTAVVSKPHSHSKRSSASSTANILIPTIQSNPFAQGDDARTYFTRPNRYFGPASTWKSWTEAERNVALSIDRVRAQDLSIHLFDAFKLKRRIRESAGETGRRDVKGKGRARGRERAEDTTADDYEDGDDEFEGCSLPKSWTAWPMPAGQVPREELLPREDGAEVFRSEVDIRPSAALEDCLIAIATRMARGRWEARQWEKEPEIGSVKTDAKMNPGSTSQTVSFHDDHGQEEDVDAEEETEVMTEREESDSDPDFPMFTSQPYTASDDIPAGDIKKGEDNKSNDDDAIAANLRPRRPVPLADDAHARQLFLPSARHILSKLDDLLLGLHKARAAYADKPRGNPRGRHASSTSRSATRGDGYLRTTESESRSQSRSRGPTSKKARQPFRDDSAAEETDVSMASAAAGAGGRSTSRRRTGRDRAARLNLRDWSDVVGMASLTGWDPAVVERASERCARFFGENMLFRTFHEGDAQGVDKSFFTEQFADGEMESSSAGGEEEDGEETDVLTIRISKPCAQCRASRSKCVSSPDERQSGNGRICQKCVQHGLECSGIMVQRKASGSLDDRVCPYESCERHTVPFRKRYHLQRHIDAMHLGRKTKETPGKLRQRQMSSTSVSIGASSDIDVDYYSTSRSRTHAAPSNFDDLDTIIGSDIIICPVRECKRHKQPFSRGTKLYEHVRRMHPEVDVNELKRLETRRRGERRGRLKRSASQSREGRSTESRISRRKHGPAALVNENQDD